MAVLHSLAETLYLGELLLPVAVAVALGTMLVKQDRAGLVAVLARQVQTVHDMLYLAAQELTDKDFRADRDADLIVKAIINTGQVAAAALGEKDQLTLTIDTNIFHQMADQERQLIS
jgi:hypothetical protein